MSMTKWISAGCLLLISLSIQAQERNVALLASACATCHGTNGYSVGSTPRLAKLDTHYFISQMEQFRTGERDSTVMSQHVMGYTEEEVRLLAEYFAKQ